MKESVLEGEIKGFSLIELMIVVSIIGVLASIALMSYRLFKLRAYNSNALRDLKNLIVDELSYHSVHDTFKAFSVADVNAKGQIVVDDFAHYFLSKDVYAVAKTKNDMLNICVKNLNGNLIYGFQSETGTIYYKPSYSGYKLKDIDCPNVTSADDFSGWHVLSAR